MKLRTIGVALLLTMSMARPAAAQRYAARRAGDVIQLEDASSRTAVSVVPSVGNMAVEMKVNGTNVLWWPFSTVEEFKARPAMSAIPFLGPWANRLDEQAFYANGDGTLRHDSSATFAGRFRSTAFSRRPQWQVVEVNADAASAWVTSRLEFYRSRSWMKQFPFAHTIEMTYRLQNGVLEVTRPSRTSASSRCRSRSDSTRTSS